MPTQDSQGRWISDDGFYSWDGAVWILIPTASPEAPFESLAELPAVDPLATQGLVAPAESMAPVGPAEPVATVAAPTTTPSRATRIMANGAVVSANGWWYWDLFKWQPLVPNPPEKAPGLFSGERMALVNVLRSHPSRGSVRQAGVALAEAFQRLGSLEAAEREVGGGETRHEEFLRVQASCPVDIVEELRTFPGGVGMQSGEYLSKLAMNKLMSTDWILLTTKRLIHIKGLTKPVVTSIYLSDVRSCSHQQPAGIGFGKLMIQTASGAGVISLDKVLGAASLASAIEQMAAWVRSQEHAAQAPGAPSAPAEDISAKLHQLAELRDGGILTREEFDSKKAELLKRL